MRPNEMYNPWNWEAIEPELLLWVIEQGTHKLLFFPTSESKLREIGAFSLCVGQLAKDLSYASSPLRQDRDW